MVKGNSRSRVTWSVPARRANSRKESSSGGNGWSAERPDSPTTRGIIGIQEMMMDCGGIRPGWLGS